MDMSSKIRPRLQVVLLQLLVLCIISPVTSPSCKSDATSYSCDVREYYHNSAGECLLCKKSCKYWISESETFLCEEHCPGWIEACTGARPKVKGTTDSVPTIPTQQPLQSGGRDIVWILAGVLVPVLLLAIAVSAVLIYLWYRKKIKDCWNKRTCKGTAASQGLLADDHGDIELEEQPVRGGPGPGPVPVPGAVPIPGGPGPGRVAVPIPEGPDPGPVPEAVPIPEGPDPGPVPEAVPIPEGPGPGPVPGGPGQGPVPVPEPVHAPHNQPVPVVPAPDNQSVPVVDGPGQVDEQVQAGEPLSTEVDGDRHEGVICI